MGIFKIQPEVIFIHVPKTAGSSMYKVLKKSYGIRLERINDEKDVQQWNHGLVYSSNNPVTKVIYGHIQAHPNWGNLYPKAKLVTWLRDPVERVVSTYYHWKTLKNGRSERQRDFTIQNLSLMEFVKSEKYKPVVFGYHTYLGKIESSKYGFIGRTEYFEQDLVRLQDYLGRKLEFKGNRENINRDKPQIDDSQRREIEKVIASEYLLYHELLAQSEKR